VQERDLAEAVARDERRRRAVAVADLQGAVGDDEEVLACVSAADDHLARLDQAPRDAPGEVLDRCHRERREHGQPPQDRELALGLQTPQPRRPQRRVRRPSEPQATPSCLHRARLSARAR
jgi:hypothetical protein